MIDDGEVCTLVHERLTAAGTAGSILLSLRFPDGITRRFVLDRAGITGTFFGTVV